MGNVYVAGAFHQDFDDGKAIGQLKVNPHSLEFTSQDYPDLYLKIPLQDLKLSLGGAQNRLLFIEHPLFRDTILFTSDRSILQDAALAGFPAVVKQIKKIARGRSNSMLIMLGVLLSLAFVVVGFFEAKQPIVHFISKKIPVEYESNIGDLMLKQMVGFDKAIQEPTLNEMTQELANVLLEDLDTKEFKIKIHLSSDPELNAFALPGGHIVLNKGFLMAVESPEEILGVLAHEIAHITQRHILQNIISGLSTYLLFDAIIGNYSGILALVAEQGPFLLARQYSRSSEMEADDVGFQMLVDRGIDPRGLELFLIRLKKRQDKMSTSEMQEKVFSLISTHPATMERIEYLNSRYRSLGTKNLQTIDFDLSTYQELLSGF